MQRLILLVFILFSQMLVAQEESLELGYESIVRELSNSRSSAPAYQSSDPLAEVKFHASVGLANSYLFVKDPDGNNINGLLNGYEFVLGIDLFSRNWLAEGAVRSFTEDELNRQNRASLKEFDLRVVYLGRMASFMKYRAGLGLAARYLNLKTSNSETSAETEFSTPASLIFAGLRSDLSKMISLGADVSYRSSLIDETADTAAIDASLHLSAHF